MLQVELPFELSLRIEQRARPNPGPPRRRRTQAGFQGLQYIGTGVEPPVFASVAPYTTEWYRDPRGILLGVQPKFSSSQVGGADVGASAATEFQQYSAARVARTGRIVQWDHQHEVAKTHAEFTAALRLTSEFMLLVGALVHASDINRELVSQLVDVVDGWRPRVRDEIMRRVMSGETALQSANAAELESALLLTNVLTFDIVEIGIGTPLYLRIRSYFNFNKEINIDTIIAMMSLCLSVAHTPPMPPPHPTSPSISCSIKDVRPHSDTATFDHSCALYRAVLKQGKIKTAQKYLTVLGFEVGGPDGTEGRKTAAARDAFCYSQGIVCTSVTDEIFQESIAAAMASRFPVRDIQQ